MGDAGRVTAPLRERRYGEAMSRKLITGLVLATAVGAAASIHRMIKPVPS